MYKPIQYIDETKINPGIKYREIDPPPSLAQFTACFWRIDSIHDILNVTHRVIPDGCIDIICDLQEKRSFISGIYDQTEYHNLNGKISYFGIRFLPNAAPFILKCNASGSLNNSIEIDRSSGILLQMTDRIFNGKNDDFITDIQTHLESFFKNYYINNRFNILLKHSLETHGSISVQDMALYHGISEKQIGRCFKDNIGISTKAFLRIIRFQNTFKSFIKDRHTNVMQAIESGFYDQSHLIKDINFFLDGIKNIY